jgi:hypothetical protein
MTKKDTSNVGDEAYRETVSQMQESARRDDDTPKTMRALAESNITHTRQAYERSKDTLEAVLESWERTFRATGQGAVAFNHRIIDTAQRSIDSSFDLAKSLIHAENLAEAMELQAAYWRNQLDTLRAQAEKICALSIRDTAGQNRQMRVKRGTDPI